jgi:hypothetical protein
MRKYLAGAMCFLFVTTSAPRAQSISIDSATVNMLTIEANGTFSLGGTMYGQITWMLVGC